MCDESFGWSNARECLKLIENLHPEIPDSKLSKYVNAKLEGKDRTSFKSRILADE